jgi:hypothetical protein
MPPRKKSRHEVATTWQNVVNEAQQHRNQSLVQTREICKQFIIMPNHVGTNTRCVVDIPAKWLDPESLHITSMTASELVQEVAVGSVSSAGVAKAFLGRSLVAHECVRISPVTYDATGTGWPSRGVELILAVDKLPHRVAGRPVPCPCSGTRHSPCSNWEDSGRASWRAHQHQIPHWDPGLPHACRLRRVVGQDSFSRCTSRTNLGARRGHCPCPDYGAPEHDAARVREQPIRRDCQPVQHKPLVRGIFGGRGCISGHGGKYYWCGQ